MVKRPVTESIAVLLEFAGTVYVPSKFPFASYSITVEPSLTVPWALKANPY